MRAFEIEIFRVIKLVKDYLLLVLGLDISSLSFNILEHDNCKLSTKLINQPVSSTLESNFCVSKIL